MLVNQLTHGTVNACCYMMVVVPHGMTITGRQVRGEAAPAPGPPALPRNGETAPVTSSASLQKLELPLGPGAIG